MEWLTGECFIRHDNADGYCIYQDTGTYSPYVKFVVPFLFCSRVKLNQLSPLGSLPGRIKP